MDLVHFIEHPALLRSEDERRTMSGREQLHALGYPCWGAGAVAARVEPHLNHV